MCPNGYLVPQESVWIREHKITPIIPVITPTTPLGIDRHAPLLPQYWGNHTHNYLNATHNYLNATRYYLNATRYYPNCLFGSKTTPTTKRYQALPTGTVRGINW